MSSNEQHEDLGLSSGSLSGEDEAEGHALRSGRATEDEEGTEAEGHGVRSGRVTEEDEGTDTEGHALKSGRVTEDDDDTEGHGLRVRI